MERLKAKIRQQQAKQEALKAAQQVQQQQQKQQEEMEARKSRLNSAFGSAFANAAKAQAEAKQKQAAAAAAGANDAETLEEVQRVLASKSNYEVLQLKPGCSSAALKKRYRELAVRLHPDKCKVEGASDAFQRAHTAYQELLKVVM